jgi:nitrite reductase/ring-hydroxylating ferredoxin subunit
VSDGLVDVGAADDFPVDRPVVVTVDGREIAVVRRGEREFYALRNICPHQAASFAAGWVLADLRADTPDGIRFDESVPVMHCPRHMWGYRLTDGVCTADPRMRVRAFPVSCTGGRVLVELSSGRTARPSSRPDR